MKLTDCISAGTYKEALSSVISSSTTRPRMGQKEDGGELRSRRRKSYRSRSVGDVWFLGQALKGKEKDFIKP